jgi:hypothetical protein
MSSRAEKRIGATCAVAGSALLFIGTYLHPMQADPNDPIAAFTEYAADGLWVASHLTQFAGVAVIVAALLLVARHLELRTRTTSARIAAAGAVASLAVAAALQAVDGIALKYMVDAWASAPPSQKETVFHAAFAIRQVEIGLASMLSLLLGLTATVYGGALLVDGAYPKWVSVLAVVEASRRRYPVLSWRMPGFLDSQWRSVCREVLFFYCGCLRLECACGGVAQPHWMKGRQTAGCSGRRSAAAEP